MSAFTKVCEESLKQRRVHAMEYGIDANRAVTADRQDKCVGYLVPLRYPCAIAGPVRVDLCLFDTFTFGRDSGCSVRLPEDMFEEEENLKRDKESFQYNYEIRQNSFKSIYFLSQ